MESKGRLLWVVALALSLLVVSRSRVAYAAPQAEASGASSRGAPAPPSEQAPGAAEKHEELEEFVPTEQIPAGSAISFPVDI